MKKIPPLILNLQPMLIKIRGANVDVFAAVTIKGWEQLEGLVQPSADQLGRRGGAAPPAYGSFLLISAVRRGASWLTPCMN